MGTNPHATVRRLPLRYVGRRGLDGGALCARPWPLAAWLRLDAVLSGQLANVGVGERAVLGDVGGPLAGLQRVEGGGDDFLPCLFVGVYGLPVAGGGLVEAGEWCLWGRIVGHTKECTGTVLGNCWWWANVGEGTEYRSQEPGHGSGKGM